MQDLEILKNSYLIIGGPFNKKSEVAKILSNRLKLKLINLDREKHSYFEDFTIFDFDKYYNLIEKYGKYKALNYIHRYEMKHLRYVLDNLNEAAVIDFGSTYTLIDDEEILNIIKSFKNIIWLYSNNTIDDYEIKLSENKVNKDIYKSKILIDDKSANVIVDEIINSKKFDDVL